MKRRALLVLLYGTLLTQIVHAGLYPNAASPGLQGKLSTPFNVIAHRTLSNGGLLGQVLNLVGNLLYELPLINGVLMQRMISRRFPTARVLSNIASDRSLAASYDPYADAAEAPAVRQCKSFPVS